VGRDGARALGILERGIRPRMDHPRSSGRASIHLTGLPTGFGLGGQGVNTISPGPIVASGIASVTVSVAVEIASMVELGPPMPSCA
jgi:hypothetical protein